MYKEVGASGQISLGKRFAGQMFDVQFLETGAVQMVPVRVVPAATPVTTETMNGATSAALDDLWPAAHAKQIAAYNAWAEKRLTFSESVREWREAQQNQALAA